MFEKLREQFPISDPQWSDYISCFKRLEVPAKTILLDEGEVSKKLFLIEKGCIRVWFNNNGKDITLQFFFENNAVASLESFRKKSPSQVVIETIEPTVVWWIHKKDLDRIIEETNQIPQLRNRLMDTLLERTFDYMKLFFSFIKDTPAERYHHLLTQTPQIIQRVPQHYIASYLGISAVHLSRIKSKMAHPKTKG